MGTNICIELRTQQRYAEVCCLRLLACTQFIGVWLHTVYQGLAAHGPMGLAVHKPLWVWSGGCTCWPFEHEIKGILPDYGWIFVFGVSDKHAIDCLLWDVWKLAPVYFTPLVIRTHYKDHTLYITGHSFSLTTPSDIRISTVFLWIEGCVNFHKTTPIHKNASR